MSQSIHFVHQSQAIEIDVDDRVVIWNSVGPEQRSLSEAAFEEAVMQALLHPTDYPPVSGGMVPGDMVAIILDAELPQPAAALRGVLRAINPLQPSRIDVVVAESAIEATRNEIREALPADVELTIHCGRTRDDLRYLAANEAANPIYLNRRIVDADLVIPVMVARGSDPILAGSTAGVVFPSLADHRSQLRNEVSLDDLTLAESMGQAQDDEAQRVAWLLGVQWTVLVEVNEQSQACQVTAGTPETVAARCRIESRIEQVPFRADMVLACVDGGQQQHSLENLLRAALAARSVAATDATIVLVSDLKEIGSLNEPEFLDDVQDDEPESYGEVTESDPDEATWIGAEGQTAADRARRLLSRVVNELDPSQRYFLMSGCAEDEVESFGFGAVQDAAALARLIGGHDYCAVLRNAQLLGASHSSPTSTSLRESS